MDLAKIGIYGCGTLRSNRNGFPTDLKPHLKKGLSTRENFNVRQCQGAKGDNWKTNHKQSNRLAVSLWQDNHPVIIISTNCDPSETTTVQRRQNDGTSISIPCPMSVYVYNKYMGGVDHNDQLRGYYNVRMKGRKFYKYIFWFLFEVALTNSYILSKNYSTCTLSNIKDFRTDLARSLIGEYNSRKRRGRPNSSCPSTTRFREEHFPTRAPKEGRCYFCYHRRHERHESYWFCNECEKHLCHDGKANDCFLLYHKSI